MSNGASWSKEIDFHCTFGVWPFKKSLDITPAGFQYCGELFPMRTITKVRWGVDQKRGGPFPKYIYIAVFGTETREITIKTREKNFYDNLTQRMWRAVGSRLLSDMMLDMKHGKSRNFGEFSVDDNGIAIVRKNMFGKGENPHFAWDELKWGIVNGNIVFTKAETPEKPIASASFLWVDNAHILSVALALLQEKEKRKSLSAAVE